MKRGQPFDIAGEVSAYFADAFLDSPGGPTDPDPMKVDQPRPLATKSFVADILDLVASEYGWPHDTILDLPLAQLWQIRNAILERRIPKWTNGQLTDLVYRRGHVALDRMKQEGGAN